MGLFGKKLTPEEKAHKNAHKKAVKEAYDKAYQEAELEAASVRGKLEGSKSTGKNGGALATIGRIAEGSLYGVNKGAKAFNDGVGMSDFNLEMPHGNDNLLQVPRGNDDIFYSAKKPRKKRKRKVN